MTFNIHHGVGSDGRLDLARVADVIATSGADVVGLQEVDRHFGARSEFVDQAGWLADRLGFHVEFGASIDLDPTEPQLPRRQYGNALLSRHPIEACHTEVLPRWQGAHAPEDRTVLCAHLTVAARAIHVYNTHLHHRTPPARLLQARHVADLLTGLTDPVVLMGDFNAPPGTAEVREISRGLVDAWEQAGHGAGHTFSAARPRVRIDYVFVSRSLRVVAAEVLATLASDHRPVVVDVAW